MSVNTLYNPDEFWKSLPAGFDGLFDWEFLRGALPRGIMPMDIDASIEVGGNFLWFETKNPGVEIPNGQEYALKAQINNGHTVICLWGKTPEAHVQATIRGPYGKSQRQINMDDGESLASAIFRAVEEWGKWADANPYTYIPPPLLNQFLKNYEELFLATGEKKHEVALGRVQLELLGFTEYNTR